MMNTSPAQEVQTVPSQTSPVLDMTQIPLDSSDPFACILVLTIFFRATERNLTAIANILSAIATLRQRSTQPIDRKSNLPTKRSH
jgi:hypothetical protein